MVPAWREMLDNMILGIQASADYLRSAEAILWLCESLCQQKFPGPYRIVLETVDGVSSLTLRFSDPESEIEWHLRWS